MKNPFLIPCDAADLAQIGASWHMANYASKVLGTQPGLMLVTFGGLSELNKNYDTILRNVETLDGEYGDGPVVIMPNCMPPGDQDFLNDPGRAVKHVLLAATLANDLPMQGRKIVSFHLGSLVSREEYSARTRNDWRRTFQWDVMPHLRTLYAHGRRLGVELAVETVPVPYFGDKSPDDPIKYRGHRLWDLIDPFVLTRDWGFEEVRGTGMRLCLDTCHSWQAGEGLQYDVDELALTDVIHLADTFGRFTFEGGTFTEGVPLGDGDITCLHEVVAQLVALNLPIVLKLNEIGPDGKPDYIGRPGSMRSIEWLVKNGFGR